MGNARLMADLGVSLGDLEAQAEALRGGGADRGVRGRSTAGRRALSRIADPIRPTARAAIDALKAAGIRIVMLTGDDAATAKAVARELGIDDVRANMLPEDKHRIVAELKAEGRVVAMGGRRGERRAPRWPRPTSASRWARGRRSRSGAPA